MFLPRHQYFAVLKYRLYYDAINEHQENEKRQDMMSNHPNFSLLWLFALGLQSVPSLVSFCSCVAPPKAQDVRYGVQMCALHFFVDSMRTLLYKCIF